MRVGSDVRFGMNFHQLFVSKRVRRRNNDVVGADHVGVDLIAVHRWFGNIAFWLFNFSRNFDGRSQLSLLEMLNRRLWLLFLLERLFHHDWRFWFRQFFHKWLFRRDWRFWFRFFLICALLSVVELSDRSVSFKNWSRIGRPLRYQLTGLLVAGFSKFFAPIWKKMTDSINFLIWYSQTRYCWRLLKHEMKSKLYHNKFSNTSNFQTLVQSI